MKNLKLGMILTAGILFFVSCQKDDEQPLWLLFGGNDAGNSPAAAAVAVPEGVDPADVTPVDNTPADSGNNNGSSQSDSSSSSSENNNSSSAASGGEDSGASAGGSGVYVITGDSQTTVNQVEQYLAANPDDSSDGSDNASADSGEGTSDGSGNESASEDSGSSEGSGEGSDVASADSASGDNSDSGSTASSQDNESGDGDESTQGSENEGDGSGNLVRLGKDYCYSEGTWFRDAEAIFTYEGNKPAGFCYANLPSGKYEVRVMARMWVKHGRPGSLPEGYENFEVMVSGDGVFADLLIPASATGLNKATGVLDITDANPTIFVTWLNQQEDVNFAIHQVKLKRVGDSERSTLVGSIKHFSQKNFSVMMMILAAILVSLGVINFMKHRTA